MADHPMQGKATGILEDFQAGISIPIGEERIGTTAALPMGSGLEREYTTMLEKAGFTPVRVKLII